MHHVAPLQRLMIEQELRSVMEQAHREYREAHLAEAGKVSFGPLAQGGTVAAVVEGSTPLAGARELYRQALEAFTGFVLYGKVPAWIAVASGVSRSATALSKPNG